MGAASDELDDVRVGGRRTAAGKAKGHAVDEFFRRGQGRIHELQEA